MLSQTARREPCILRPNNMPSRRKSKSKSPASDPFAGREAQNYDNPIASREHILDQLEQLGEPALLEQLAEMLGLGGEEGTEALRRRLNAMARDGQIIRNRKGAYGLTAHMDLQSGRVQGTKDGAGYFIPDDAGEDLFLSPREMSQLFDGDRVLARFTGYETRGKREGTVVEILQRRYEEIVGRYFQEKGYGIVLPDNKRVTHEIVIPPGYGKPASDGQYVSARIMEYPNKRSKAVAEITAILGDVTTPGIEIDVALHSFDIPHQWPSSVQKETARIRDSVSEEDKRGRFDLRELPLVTIDGEDAKDFDDAVFARRHGSGWTLFVAIADVSHYVRLNTALDKEAEERGTSVYFPGHVVPMLPEKLSNGLCSLKPETDRLAMVCEMEISPQGELKSYCFSEAVIYSHARLTYTEVSDMLQEPANETAAKIRARLRKVYGSLLPSLEDLYSLFKALKSHRSDEGAMEFESVETRIVFAENKKIKEIIPVERNDAHKMIEECMLCANVAAARLLESMDVPALYRIHEGPNPDKLAGLRDFLFEMGLKLGGGDRPNPSDYQQTLRSIADRPDRNLLQTMMIRSMMQAVYQPENIGHFGLGFPAYTHFTSPIRRYPDLLVHRAIRYLIRNKRSKNLRAHDKQSKLGKGQIYPYSLPDLISLGESTSTAERRADAASYSVVNWLKCEYMKDRVGDVYEGTVTSVTSFGLFVELQGIYIEGLLHITELDNDYYHFDPARHCLEGERTHNIFRLGDVLEVRVARVDLEEKQIDLQLTSSRSGGKSSSRGGHNPQGKSGKKSNKDKFLEAAKKEAESRSNRGSRGKRGGSKSGKTNTGKGVAKKGAGKQSAGRTRGGADKKKSPAARKKTSGGRGKKPAQRR
jgi:ribonuclease R